MSNSISLSALRKTELSSIIATQDWTKENFLSGVKINGAVKTGADGVADLGTVLTAHQSLTAYTPLSVTNDLSTEVIDGLSNVIAPKLSDIADLELEQSQKINAISSELSNYSLTSHTHSEYALTSQIPTNYLSGVTMNGSTVAVTNKVANLGTVLTAHQSLTAYTPLTTTTALSNEVFEQFSSNIYPDLSVVKDLVSAEVDKLDNLSGQLSNYSLTSHTHSQYALTSQIPTVNDATLTIQKNGSNVQTFSANQSSPVTANIVVPTDLSDLTNNAGYAKKSELGDVLEYKGTKTLYSQLPSSGNTKGDVWNVVSANGDYPPGTNYAWDGSAWDPLGGSIDVSVFATKSELNALSGEVIDGLSNVIAPKLSDIADLEEEQTQKINVISSELSNYALTSHTHSQYALTSQIPTVNNGTLTIQKNGSNIQTFTANQSGNVSANIEVPEITVSESSITVDGSTVTIPTVALDGNELTINEDSITIPAVSLEGSTVYVNGDSVSVPTVYLDGNTLTVDEGSVTIPQVYLDGNTLTVDESSVTIPDVSLNGYDLTVDGYSVTIPDVSLNGNDLAVNGSYVTVPDVSLDGNSLTVDGYSVTVPDVSLEGNSLTVDGNTTTIPEVSIDGNTITVNSDTLTIPTSTSELTNDSGFITSAEVDTKISGFALKTDIPSNYLSGVTMNGSPVTVTNKVVNLGTVLTAHQSLTAYTPLSVTNDLSSEVVNGLSNVIAPKLSAIADLEEEQSQKINAISSDLSNYSLTTHNHDGIYAKLADISAAINTLDGSITGTAGAGKTLTSFSQTDGKVAAGFGDISITKSQITDFPTIPTVNDGTLTIQKNGSAITSFTANQSNSVTANITVPLSTSQLTNDSGFLTAHQSLTAYTPLTVTNALSSEVVNGLSNVVAPKLSTIGDLTIEQSQNISEISEQLSTFAKKTDIPSTYISAISINGGASLSVSNRKVDIPLSNYVSLSSYDAPYTIELTQEQKDILTAWLGSAAPWGDFAISVSTSDGIGYIGNVDCFSAQLVDGKWVFVGGIPALNDIGWVANVTVMQDSLHHDVLNVDGVSVDVATKEELANYLPMNGGGIVTGNIAIENLNGDNLFSLNNYGKVAIGVGADIGANAQYGIAIGRNTNAGNGGIAIYGAPQGSGISSNVYGGIAIGDSIVSGGDHSIQFGNVDAGNDSLFRVWKYPLLDGKGDIPYGRLSAEFKTQMKDKIASGLSAMPSDLATYDKALSAIQVLWNTLNSLTA